jgi:lipopolysaccharide export system protein LptC
VGGRLKVDHGAANTAPVGRPARASARAYRQARRHSRIVRLFRIAIPVGAALAIGSVMAIAIFDPFGRMGGLSLGPVTLSGTKITMEQPRMTGYRKNARGYEMTAVAALQDIRKPTIIELKQMKARMAMDDQGAQAHLTALSGVFDSQKEQLELQDDIYVRTDNNQEVWLKSARADFKAGTVSSKEAVRVKLPTTTIEADALDITDNGRVISFIGRVRTVIESAAAAPAAQKAAPAPEAPARTSQAEPVSLRQ